MGINLTANIRGIGFVTQRLRSSSKKLSTMRGANLAAVLVLRRWVGDNFDAEGTKHKNSSLRWKPLSESTVAQRRKGPGAGTDKILQDTGRLKGGWKTYADNKSGRLASQVKYSWYHEKGSTKAHLPRRKILPTKKHAKEITLPVYDKFVARSLR